jgi:hypothetical protein
MWALIEGSSTLSKISTILTKAFINFHQHPMEQHKTGGAQSAAQNRPVARPTRRTFEDNYNYDRPSKTPHQQPPPFDTVHKVPLPGDALTRVVVFIRALPLLTSVNHSY